MADVPDYGGFKAAPTGPGGFAISVPSQEGFQRAPQELARTSQNLARQSDAYSQQLLKAQEDANRVRVMEASNQAREAALRMTYDPEEGYTRIKGGDVLPRDGNPIAVDYAGRYREQLAKIGGGLANDQQKQMFAEQAMRLSASFEAGVSEHEAREWTGYELSVADGARQLSTQAIAKNYSNPAVVDEELANLRSAVATLGEKKGLSANEIVAAQATNESGALVQAIAGAMESRDLTTAEALFERYKDKLVANDLIRVKGAIEKEQDGRLVMQAADAADGLAPVPGAGAALAIPVQGGRITSKFGDSRPDGPHGGVDFAVPVGTPVQAPAAGKVVKVWEDGKNGKAVRIQFADGSIGGFAHLSEQNVAVGDTVHRGQVFAKSGNTGHSTGPHLHYRLEKDGKPVDPLAQSGTVTSRAPTLDEAWAAARHTIMSLRPDASPELLRAARDEVESRWRMHEASQRDAEENALKSVYGALDKNGGNFNALPPSLRNAIPPGKKGSVMEYARSLQGGAGRAESDLATYADLAGHPEKLMGMSDSDFLALRPKLSDGDFKAFARARGDKGSGDPKDFQALNREAINRVVGNRMDAMGLSEKEEPARVAAVRMTIDKSIYAAQAALGRKMTDAEVEQHVDRMFTTTLPTRSWMGEGKGGGLFSFKADQIPDVERQQLVEAFKRRGNSNPSEADLLSAWYLKRSRKTQ